MSLDFLCILFYPTGSPLICLPCAISAMSSTESSKPEKVVQNKATTLSRAPYVCGKKRPQQRTEPGFVAAASWGARPTKALYDMFGVPV